MNRGLPAVRTILAVLAAASCAHAPPPNARDSAPAISREARVPVGWPGPAPIPAQPLPRVAIVIDDVGQSFEAVEPFLALPLSLSFAVLPFLDRATDVARDLAALGRDVLVHVPMEPCDPATIDGPGFLMASMDGSALAATLAGHLDRVPGAIGANNHMGSHLTTDREAMRAVVAVLADRNLFVLDSRTSADTALLAVAVQAGVPAIRRHVFLDDDPSPGAVRAQVDELLRIAKAQGCAVAVGHPRPTTFDALRELASRLDAGVRFVPVSRLVSDPCGRLDPPPKGRSGR